MSQEVRVSATSQPNTIVLDEDTLKVYDAYCFSGSSNPSEDYICNPDDTYGGSDDFTSTAVGEGDSCIEKLNLIDPDT